MCIVQLDLKNAFNAISRLAVEEALINDVPYLLKAYYSMYQNTNLIICNRNTELPKTLYMNTGVCQGGTLSGIYFEITINYFLNKYKFQRAKKLLWIYFIMMMLF